MGIASTGGAGGVCYMEGRLLDGMVQERRPRWKCSIEGMGVP